MMFWPRSSRTALRFTPQVWRVRGVLLAWLLVLAAGLLAPWAQARGLEAVCSSSGATHWTLGPDADHLAHAMQGLDCPLCPPQLAAPPAARPTVLAGLPQAAEPHGLAMAWTPVPSACPPPARGPPGMDCSLVSSASHA